MKGIGYLLIAVGFLVGSLVAVQTSANEVPWTWFVPAALLGVIGVVLARLGLRQESHHEEALTANVENLHSSIERVVENIVRHFSMRKLPPLQAAITAVNEVGNPTILATLTVIAAVLPMAFVRGLMGPYMRPIPVGASAAMIFSLLVAFVITPWAAVRLLKSSRTTHHGGGQIAK